MTTEQIDLLDYGYVKFIDSFGGDESIIEAARMSTNKGFLGWGPTGWMCPHTDCGWKAAKCPQPPEGPPRCPACNHTGLQTVPGDEKLLRYLYENKHATPFEFAGLVIEVKAPILVFREWHRHRTQSYNEMSARYTPLPNENYIPSVERLLINSKKNKQAGTVKGAHVLDEVGAHAFRVRLAEEYQRQEDLYQTSLSAGVPKELARCVLPVGRYSKMRASTCLRNWLAFLSLRAAPSAQWEIRSYADAVGSIIEQKFPQTWKLFAEGQNG